jgi:quinol monooxygenase YgiN
MTIKVLLKRKYTEDQAEDLKGLINALRSATHGRPGYISGETLYRTDKPGECLVIAKWRTRYDWEQWHANPARAEIQAKIDALLKDATTYEIYEYE